MKFVDALDQFTVKKKLTLYGETKLSFSFHFKVGVFKTRKFIWKKINVVEKLIKQEDDDEIMTKRVVYITNRCLVLLVKKK